ncbi:protein Gawky [Drosophila eugracilis]|uniref:protein Gawky n=1 Tax=Drosophila eugracilis TaxID=29029 RepID=UPI0007E67861|nr:protein Gawky [Drosophila eugracilis]XP_017062675.1 protein Gawky [Drosophila eugracilis]XP_017062676.1 protein Gawky [Drosophila eugracilis]XP_017062677.1 protein Gawky [Drosophila eugracilis]XP_017062678.1 protein Gawky [Drosophila eugracilis]XP_017062679.1 protein Gawky [Drosophila eugracilis]XP_017062680.1 protein Gawky [Drosophila eugracilis]
MREALFSQDGWGCQHVNQDTNWEVPSSPEPTNKDAAGPPMWKPSINNGTDLWESNLRNGGQPTAQQVQKPSWGHTPSSNLGGTWGEDDDGTDSSSVWTGGSVSNAGSGAAVVVNQGGVNVGPGGVSTSGPQWGQGVVGVGLGSTGNGSSNLTGTAGVVSGASGNSSSTGNGWGDPREIRPLAGGNSMDIRNVDHRGVNNSVANSSDPRDIRMIDPRDPIRGDPRGISGRLNGTSEMWGHHPQMSHNQMQNINKMVGQTVATVSTNVGGTSGTGIGPGVPGSGSVSGNIPTQWGPAQAVAAGVSGPKDISKQISGWEEPSPPPQRRSIPNYDDGTSLWGQQTRVPGATGHWKDMTDSIGRGGHPMRGQNQSGGIGIAGVGNSNVPVGANPNNPMNSVVGPQARIPSVGGVQHKQDGGTMWVHSNNVSGRNNVAAVNTWGDDTHNVNVSAPSSANVSTSNWVDDKSNATLAPNSWSDAAGVSWGNKQSKLPSTGTSSGWSTAAGVGVADGVDLGSDWNAHGGIIGKSQQQQKLPGLSVGMVNVINAEMIKQSKQYRILVENGFKKEDVERALVTANMNIEEAADMLRASSSLAMEGWRRHEESIGSYSDHTSSTSSSGFVGRYPVSSGQPSMAFTHNNLLNNIGGTAVTGGGNNNTSMSTLQVQKYLNQGQHSVAVGPQTVGNSSAVSVGFGQNTSNAAVASTASVNLAANTNQPSGQQIRMLGQQIQLAIHSGFISSQILTQPLTQTTLNLLNQLLSNIKHLQAAQQSLARGGNANPMAVNVAISKYKQQIQNLQNQINAQQAVYVKQPSMQQTSQQQPQQQPQQQQHPSSHLNNSGNDYLRGHDAINNLQSNFSELNINKPSGYQGASNQQSRLNQWKLPVLDKDMNSDNTEFSRAPGTTKQSLTNNSSNISSLGLQNDGTWSTGRNIGDGWPDPQPDNENKDWSVAQPTSAATAYTDMVQEFEPGKPWKGSQIKSIEDDPSITPGSVARSPLSINSTPKDADIFASTGKNSPTDLPLSLSSSTWSFNPNQNFPSWSDNSQQCATTSELWTSPLNKSSSRGPPPGLTANSNKSGNGGNASTPTPSNVTGGANGWLQTRSGSVQTTNTTWTSGNSSWGSSWLLLKNLTAQIDGPTLRTLCMQHGPLVSFHLYLNQGIALCKYTTREEANKAQMALNNCVLANTTIFAESPSENDVQNIMQHLPQIASSASSSGTSAGNGGAVGTPSNNGASSSGASLSGNTSNGNSNGNTSASGGGSGNNGNNTGTSSGGGICNQNTTSLTNSNLLGSSGGTASNSSGGAVSSGTGSVGAGTSSSNSINGGPGSANTTVSKSSSNNLNITGGQSSASNLTNSTNSTWRQTSQTQALQGQSRSSGREADFDYISLVYSIVDD